MPSWRDQILKVFTPQVARLTLVADPDGLLLEEGTLHGIRERGFELIPFEDHVAFRYAYESKFRSRWDHGEHTDLVVVLRSPSSDLNYLPYDLLQAGRRLSFNIGDLFPNLSYPVVAALDRGDLDALFRAQLQHTPGNMGDNATKEFALRHVFEIAPELIKQHVDCQLFRYSPRGFRNGLPVCITNLPCHRQCFITSRGCWPGKSATHAKRKSRFCWWMVWLWTSGSSYVTCCNLKGKTYVSAKAPCLHGYPPSRQCPGNQPLPVSRRFTSPRVSTPQTRNNFCGLSFGRFRD